MKLNGYKRSVSMKKFLYSRSLLKPIIFPIPSYSGLTRISMLFVFFMKEKWIPVSVHKDEEGWAKFIFNKKISGVVFFRKTFFRRDLINFKDQALYFTA